jgi:hypothetical protein
MANLYLTSGDDYAGVRALVITVTDPDTGDTIDISATDMTFMVKENRGDADEDALIAKTTPTDITIANPQTGATKGLAYLTIDAADTVGLAGRYRWELEGDDSGGVITLADGVLFVKGDLIVGPAS